MRVPVEVPLSKLETEPFVDEDTRLLCLQVLGDEALEAEGPGECGGQSKRPGRGRGELFPQQCLIDSPAEDDMHRNVGGSLASVPYDDGVAPYEREPGAAEVDVLAFPRFSSVLRG